MSSRDRERSPSRKSNHDSRRSEAPKLDSSVELPKIGLDYKFGDAGSSWRMMKYKRTLEAIEENNTGSKTKNDIVLQRYGSELEFEVSRQEREELDLRPKKPPKQWVYEPTLSIQHTMRYSSRISSSNADSTKHVDRVSLKELVEQERCYTEKFDVASARAILKDSKYEDNHDYPDEKAAALSEHVRAGKISRQQLQDPRAIARIVKNLERCELCHRNPQDIIPVSMGQYTFLSLLPYNSYNKLYPSNTTVICINEHYTNTLYCEDEEWDEIENFMKTLATFYYKEYKKSVIFIENAIDDGKYQKAHAHILAVPILMAKFNQAPGYFKQGFIENSDDLDEGSYRSLVIDTLVKSEGLGSGRRQMGFKKLIAKEAPYFHVWFTLDGGLGHVIEDTTKWPKYDLFTRRIVGEGILNCEDPMLVNSSKNYKTWQSSAHKGEEQERVDKFRKKWGIYDWTTSG